MLNVSFRSTERQPLYGMTDVLLTSAELIAVLCMLFTMMALVSGSPLQQSGNDACRAEV